MTVIGRGGYQLDRARAWDAVAGITCGQDLSERVLQLAGTPAQFCLGKSFPGFRQSARSPLRRTSCRTGTISGSRPGWTTSRSSTGGPAR